MIKPTKNVLLLLNNAPDVKKYIMELKRELKEHNINPVILSESRFYNYVMDAYVEPKYIFSDFYKSKAKVPTCTFMLSEFTNINIWDTYFSDHDRNYYLKNVSTKELERKLILLNYFVHYVIKKEKIDLVFNEPVSNSFNHTAFNIASLLKVPYLGLVYSRLPQRVEFMSTLYPDSDVYKTNFEILKNNDSILTNEDNNYISNYLDNFFNIQPDYMKVNGLGVDKNIVHLYAKSSKFNYIKNSIKYIYKEYQSDLKANLQVGNPLTSSYNTFKRQLLRKLKVKWLTKVYADNDGFLSTDFLLYPLHYHPESSTSIWAKHFLDELNTLKNIAFNLPVGVKLVVKDHPSAAGFPSKSFYKELKALPNVVLISHAHNTKKIIKSALGVITLTSTVGFEALVLNKPVITLGEIFYQNHPLCYKLTSFNKLFKHVSHLIRTKGELFEDPKLTVGAYYMMTEPVTEGTVPTIINKIIED